METIDIKGKAYITVNERIKEFHRLYPNGSIITNFHSYGEGVVIMKATVTPNVDNPPRYFTGVAYENEGSTFINKTSYIENCETSAVGRALGMLGIGIDVSVASADEEINAVNNQCKEIAYITDSQRSQLLDMIADTESDMDKFLKYLKVDAIDKLPQAKFKMAMTALEKKKGA
jgi:DNA modification methylase